MKILRIFIGSIGILFLITSLLYGYEESYGIISGSKVQFRIKPDLKSKVHRHFLEGELVVYSGRSDNKMKIGNTSHYWYNVKTMDNKEGWVYGKFINCIDQKTESGKLYMKAIYDWLLSEYSPYPYKKYNSIIINNNNSIIYNVELGYLLDKEYITFQFAELTNNGEFNVIDGYSILYKIFNSNLRMVLYTTPNNIEFHFLDRYIIRESKKGIIVYDTKKYIKGNYYFLRKEKEYKRIDRIHLRQVIKDIRKFHDSYIEFDKKKKKAIMHLRLEKDQPMHKRVYKFKDGKFILIEDE